jgi:hypothetical protein
VKKACFVNILLLGMMIAIASCSSAPKSQQTDSVVPEVSENEAPPPITEIPEEIVEADIEEEIEEVAVEAAAIEDTVDEEPVLAEEKPPVEIVEPEPPVVAVVPEPEPSLPQTVEPPPPATPPPEPPRVTAPPQALPQTPPPAVVRPTPPPPPVVPPIIEEEKPPVAAAEPPLRDIPELPNPTPGISGRQDVPPVVFSRVVRATVGQLVEVPFRGTGWVYLGETGAQRGIAYDSRRLEPEGQSFIFRTERAGEYALKFYRQDFIRDFIINDYVQVIVGAPAETAGTGWFSPPVDRGRVIAEPRWPSSLTEAEALRADSRPAQPDVPAAASPAGGSTASAPVTTAPVQPPPTVPSVQPQPALPPPIPSTTPPVTPPAAVPDTSKNTAPELPAYIDPAVYLEKAQEEFAAGRIASAISFLDQFCEHYPSGTDETWWLYGQFYEANSPSRNILTALNCYRRLVQEYPQSSRFDDARKRIAYLQRYYININ